MVRLKTALSESVQFCSKVSLFKHVGYIFLNSHRNLCDLRLSCGSSFRFNGISIVDYIEKSGATDRFVEFSYF